MRGHGYDTPAANGNAVRALGEPTLTAMTRELRESERNNIAVGWAVRENVWVQARVRVRRTLRTCGYPPDRQHRRHRRRFSRQGCNVLGNPWTPKYKPCTER
ncbi:MAG: DUF3387 domain-containing protein [Candidatus Tectomicrobia bacterium]|nr:DUF3387 domain-containing protein [Candidatus Tectomicrobia bacterium]